METETIDSIQNKMSSVMGELNKKMKELEEKKSFVEGLFKPAQTKTVNINGKKTNIALTDKGAIIINFVDIAEAKAYYNKIK